MPLPSNHFFGKRPVSARLKDTNPHIDAHYYGRADLCPWLKPKQRPWCWCGGFRMVVRDSDSGPFWGCPSAYCNETRPIDRAKFYAYFERKARQRLAK